MTAQTRTDEVILALVAAWSADAQLVALSCRVYDGPFDIDIAGRYRLFVGSTGLDEDDLTAAESEFVSPHAANVARDEAMRITCAAWYGDGSTDMARIRSRARTIVDEAIAHLRTDPGIALSNVFYGGMDALTLRQIQTNLGATAVYTFVVRFVARTYS